MLAQHAMSFSKSLHPIKILKRVVAPTPPSCNTQPHLPGHCPVLSTMSPSEKHQVTKSQP